MKVFLSHSSKDKGFVNAVVDCLAPGTYEIDSETFDLGLVNSEAIVLSLKRCDMFCLFLSSSSLQAPYVDFETLFGVEFFARGDLVRILVLCIDDRSYSRASENVRYFNICKKRLEPESAARLIQGHLIQSAEANTSQGHPFIGRQNEISALGDQVTSHRKPASKALFVSGHFGSGRRTITRQFYRNYFPQVVSAFPTIKVEPFAGLEELYRLVLTALRPTIPARDLLVRLQGFRVASDNDKGRMIADQLNALLESREATFILDAGGVLAQDGSFIPDIDRLFEHLEDRPYPVVAFISPRTIPHRARRAANDISYLSVGSLDRQSTEAIISTLCRTHGIALSDDGLERLVELSDSHPFNIYKMIGEIRDSELQVFLANPRSFVEWKHRQSSEYLKGVELNRGEITILAMLKIVPELDFASVADASEEDAQHLSEAMLRLLELHIVETVQDTFFISPPVRIAVERDTRIRLETDRESATIRRLARVLSLGLEEGTAPVVLINATVLASLQSGVDMPDIASAFLLPSHYIWVAKRNYDNGHWDECIRYARKAIEGRSRLSIGGVVGACRFLCLAASRIGDQTTFVGGITILETLAENDGATSNVNFLKGFNSRLQGHVLRAEEYFRKANKLEPGNASAARELASVCLDRGNLDEAERFAREAYQHAGSNPYLVDILVAVLIRQHGKQKNDANELDGMFQLLEQVGEEAGKSFYTTRRAEFEHMWGDNNRALELIEEAINKTPNLFEPRRLHATILLKAGNKVKALEVIETMKRMVNKRDPNVRRKNYRQYLQTQADYLVEVNEFEEAKKIFNDTRVFSDEERRNNLRDIETIQAYRQRR